MMIMMPEPEKSIFYQPGVGEAESTFATMGADDVADVALDIQRLELATSIFYQFEPGAGEAESTFAILGADDVALDMDTEVGYISEDESNDGSEDHFDDSVD